jgi:hypothetical protein
MARTDPQVNIRMPIELKERIESVLPETKRSLNAEIIQRLEESFAPAWSQTRDEKWMQQILPDDVFRILARGAERNGTTPFAELLMRIRTYYDMRTSEKIFSRLALEFAKTLDVDEYSRLRKEALGDLDQADDQRPKTPPKAK